MRFAIRPSEGGTDFRAAVFQARRAEEYGIDTVYLGEHHGWPESPYWPSPVVGLAALARETEEVTVGTNILQLPLATPVRVAGEIAYLDRIADGQTVFGFGVGWRQTEFDAFGIPRAERGRRMTEHLRLLNALFEPGPTDFDGEFYSVEDFEVSPRPVQTPRPDFHIGGMGEHVLERVSELAEGWVAAGGALEEEAAFAQRVRERGGDVVQGTGGVVVRETHAEAVEATTEFVKCRTRPHMKAGSPYFTAGFEDYLESQGRELRIESEADLEAYLDEQAAYEIGGDLSAYTEENVFIAGTPEECVEQIDRIADTTGCDELNLRISCAGWGREATMETLDLLGREVLPSF
jgi:alkanesulfonate monooxygenase SsuD/methylene tetrahydromethanopterin reductase-like flavin-dependent oxidoreductase (luciferase family)